MSHIPCSFVEYFAGILQPNGQEEFHFPFPFTKAEALCRYTWYKGHFLITELSAFTYSFSIGELNFQTDLSFRRAARHCEPSLPLWAGCLVFGLPFLSLNGLPVLSLLCRSPAVCASNLFPLSLCTQGEKEKPHKHGWYSTKQLC